MNVVIPSTYNGVSGKIRPTLVGDYSTGCGATLSNGNASFIHGTACATLLTGCSFYAQPAGCGSSRRNALTGPGFADFDVSLEKTTRLAEAAALVLRVDAFDMLNHTNFANKPHHQRRCHQHLRPDIFHTYRGRRCRFLPAVAVRPALRVLALH